MMFWSVFCFLINLYNCFFRTNKALGLKTVFIIGILLRNYLFAGNHNITFIVFICYIPNVQILK